MKVAVVSRDKDLISRWLNHHGLKKVMKNPDIVIALGGDGTFLFAEQKFPGVPKVLIYHGSLCEECRVHDFGYILDCLKNKKYSVQESMKLEILFKGKKYLALNDVNVHYTPPTALRYEVLVNDDNFGTHIGDGVVVSTPYGSTGYYKSITRSRFSKGIGVALNNIVNGSKSKVVSSSSILKIKILRGPGVLAVDCVKKTLNLKSGDVLTLRKAKTPAKLIKLRNYPVKIVKY